MTHEQTLSDFFHECEAFDPREMPAIRHALAEIVRERDNSQAKVVELEKSRAEERKRFALQLNEQIVGYKALESHISSTPLSLYDLAAYRQAYPPQKPRPMSEAPSVHSIYVVRMARLICGGWAEDPDRAGWLPCPPDTDKPDSMGLMHGKAHADVGRSRAPRSNRSTETDKSGETI